jgi:ribose 5-phosphate isomerase B
MKHKVALGADEAGFELKETIKSYLQSKGYEVSDYRTSAEPVDYPDVAQELAKDIADHKADRGILICGTGIGMAIAANKVPGISAAQAHDTYSAERARKSNNAQIVTMGARVIGPELAKQIVDSFLTSEFQEGNSRRKVDKITALERSYSNQKK